MPESPTVNTPRGTLVRARYPQDLSTTARRDILVVLEPHLVQGAIYALTFRHREVSYYANPSRDGHYVDRLVVVEDA